MEGIWLVSHLALWVLFLVVAIVLISVLRNLGVIYESMEALAPLKNAPTKLQPGERLPEMTSYSLAGEKVPLSKFHGTKTAFSIISPACTSCNGFLRRFGEEDYRSDPLDPTVKNTILISTGHIAETIELLLEVGWENESSVPVVVDKDKTIVRKWGITRVPATIITDEDLRVVRQVFP